MKKILNINNLIICSLLLLSTGCKKTLDINESPNNPGLESATAEVLFPSAVMSTAGRVGGDLSIVGGLWAQFYTQNNNSSQFRNVDIYNLASTSTFVNGPYTELFSGALFDYQLGITKSIEKQNWSYNLMNTVMKAYTFEILVDLYDKVPYTEAFQSPAILQPKFDDGYTIYTSLIKEIDAALAKDYTSVEFSSDQMRTDFIFGSSSTFADEMENWHKFANTLKLKMYLRMVNAKPAEAEAGIRALYASNAEFLDLSAAVSNFTDVPNRSNPFYEYNFRRLNTPDNLKASVTFTSWLNKNNDPRSVAYFGVANPVPSINQGDYLGGSAHPEYNKAVNIIVNATDPVNFISVAESYFMQAEVLERYFGGAGAEAMYNDGVAAAFAQVGITPSATILATYAYPTGSFETKLEAIITQKWASLVGSHGLEAFFEQNRTGYPKTSPVFSTDPTYIPGQIVFTPNAVTGVGNFPRRYVFPNDERSRNTNTPAEVPVYTKVWWGK
ncbi:SusD/RagB family nutrient-binding outer membrane lipoprotein [Pedobacter hartonius]|uniref:Susd and RagB outer membrane lipoprotein n=1 Tax=Pedobacter hartonius TaxID=425514 RepID=A0A1H4F768_9SPHI|nr:SusD/RagB family nutrient-binding outer membrane lipoprotein [Pedobacter hartonius]SEA92757.1 Susd and RagB outer membrane lipoprotein [Pedobacter hartonius]